MPYHLKDIGFYYSALDWAAPHELQYSYRLDGLDEAWSALTAENKVEFRNLSPGHYNFQVRAIGAARQWSEVFEYPFRIRPPWWRTWWAYFLWTAIVSGAAYWFYRFQLSRQLARAEAFRLQELDVVKSRLYTNITHEFRTPLTVILGMVDQMVVRPAEWLESGADMIRRNGRHLLRLVNQMLDLSKLESGKFQLQMVRDDVVPYLRYLLDSFHSLAANKDITLHFHSEEADLVMDYDPDSLLKIVSNLVSNAIKFTGPGGAVYLTVALKRETNGQVPSREYLSLHVRDTGIGIPQDKLPGIFDRFYQVDNSSTRRGEGTGIGLALTRELVTLLEGKIEVESAVGEGTVFSISLPIQQNAPLVAGAGIHSLKANMYPLVPHQKPGASVSQADISWSEDRPIALIVEDNADVVTYLHSCLEAEYQVEIAYNGREAIEKALEIVPDIIISDIMMPEKDGLELCDTVKNDERTSHIPVVLLTAKADIASKIAGLKRGADVYLPKPFHREELLVHLSNLIEQRRKLQARYQGEHPQSAAIDPFAEMEDAFLQKIKTVVEENLGKADFDIEWLARRANMSRVQLFRKIKALTGKSPSLFVRAIRLQKAKILLQTTALNVSEIAYEVGFSDPAFFSKTFREAFGVLPTEWREKK